MVSTRALDEAGEREWRNQIVESSQITTISKNFIQLRNELLNYLERIRTNDSKIIKKGFFGTIYPNGEESKKICKKLSELFQEGRDNQENVIILRSLFSSVKRGKTKLTQIIEILRTLK